MLRFRGTTTGMGMNMGVLSGRWEARVSQYGGVQELSKLLFYLDSENDSKQKVQA